jgi:signal transduction histidine kinase
MLLYQSEEELLRLNMERDLYTDPTERARLVEQFRREAAIRGIDVQWKRRDGERIVVKLSGRPIYGEDGEFDGFEMIAEDVSDRRALETQLRQAQKMEAVGELTGGVAHDLNNVLTIVSANLDLVTDAIPAELTHLRSDLEETQAAARRGRALIKKLLGFSRRSKLEVKPTRLGQLVTDVSAMLQRVVPENIRVLITVEPGHDVIDADTGAMEQILINLVTNARDAMPDGGDITINVCHSHLEDGYLASRPWARLRDCVGISVTDTGTGMDESTRERVFEPFFTTKPHGVGTGLGLAMVYGLVKQHGGVIDVASEVGSGTTISMHFPLSTAETTPQTKEETPSEVRGGTETVLVVEDEEPIRRVARRVLEKHGYDVVLAVDGEDALRIYRDQCKQIELVISDIVMPKVGGMKFYETLRKEGHPPKILFTSGYTARDVRDSGMFDPSLPFLHKPWSVTELLQKVREVLDSGSPASD